jgi:hypothetical protein
MCLILHSVTSDFLQNSINCSSAFPQPTSLHTVNITLSSSSHKLRNRIPRLSEDKPRVSLRIVSIPTVTELQILLRRIVRIAHIPIRT